MNSIEAVFAERLNGIATAGAGGAMPKDVRELYTQIKQLERRGKAETEGEEAGFSARKLDFVKLNFKQAVDRMTEEMLEQARQTGLGREVLKESRLANHKYVADIAVSKISHSLARLEAVKEQQSLSSVMESMSLSLDAVPFTDPSLVRVGLSGKGIAAHFAYENALDRLMPERVTPVRLDKLELRPEVPSAEVDEAALVKSILHDSSDPDWSILSSPGRISRLVHRQRELQEFASVERKYLRQQAPRQTPPSGVFRERKQWAQAAGVVALERKEVSRATKSKVHVKELFIRSEVVREFELEEEDRQASELDLLLTSLAPELQQPSVAGHKTRATYAVEDDSSLLLREEAASMVPRPSSDLLHPLTAQPVEQLLFYDEHLDEDGFDADVIEELFLNPRRKPVRISKDRGAAHISPIGSEDGDSDSSIQENETYQALQKIKFPVGALKVASREVSPDPHNTSGQASKKQRFPFFGGS